MALTTLILAARAAIRFFKRNPILKFKVSRKRCDYDRLTGLPLMTDEAELELRLL